MAGSSTRRIYHCEVVHEDVIVSLRTRQKGGFSGRSYKQAQCDQELCQYVDANEPPCPLRPAMFGPDAELPDDADLDDAPRDATPVRPRGPYDGFG